MRIALISDLHFEFPAATPLSLDRDVDVLIVPGDIDRPSNLIERLRAISNGHAKHIVFCAGNHEFYGGRVDKVIAQLTEEATGNIHFLNNNFVVLDGVMFAGGTLWTDYNLDGRQPLDMLAAGDYMNDHRRIKIHKNGHYGKMRPRDALEFHQETVRFLAAQLASELPKVFVTHHAPSRLSVNAKYEGDNLNSAYASDLSWMMEPYTAPSYWFHGHMHDPVEYQLYNTKVVANPRGYPNENVNPRIKYDLLF